MYDGSNATRTDAAPSAPPVLDRVNSIRGEISMAHNLLDALSERLGPVLAPDSPKTAGGVGPQAVRDNVSPLHGVLGDALGGVESVNNRVRDLLNRLTV